MGKESWMPFQMRRIRERWNGAINTGGILDSMLFIITTSAFWQLTLAFMHMNGALKNQMI